MTTSTDEIEKFRHLARKFLVHSFLYYQCNESLIEDHEYDHICLQLQHVLSHVANQSIPEQTLIQNTLGKEGSGFSIRKYPDDIITVATALLYQQRYSDKMDFPTFVKRQGLRFVTS